MFFIILGVLFAASMATFFFLMREDKVKETKQTEYQARISQLEGELIKKDRQNGELITQLKNEFNVKEQQFNAQLDVSTKKLLASQEELNKETINKQTLEEKIRELEVQVSKFKKELELSTEMYDGLKVQYDDLERDLEKIQQAAMNKGAAAK